MTLEDRLMISGSRYTYAIFVDSDRFCDHQGKWGGHKIFFLSLVKL